MMKTISDKIYYKEIQKMENNKLIIFIIFFSISSLFIAITVLYMNQGAALKQILMIVLAIVASDVLFIFYFKKLKLELAVTKNGLYFKLSSFWGKTNFVDWNDVTAICVLEKYIKNSIYKRVYNKIYFISTIKPKGIDLTFVSGKKIYITLKDANKFKKAFNKLGLQLIIA